MKNIRTVQNVCMLKITLRILDTSGIKLFNCVKLLSNRIIFYKKLRKKTL